MRLNAYIAQVTGVSRRQADSLIEQGRVSVGALTASFSTQVNEDDSVRLDGKLLPPLNALKHLTVILNKPTGYVVSRNGQGNKTIYDLLPKEMHKLKPVGRLDKDSSGLLLLTNDGQLAFDLTHPSKSKQKHYKVALDKALSAKDEEAIRAGLKLSDGISRLSIRAVSPSRTQMTIIMSEGRNRQIRRTFEALGYRVIKLQRFLFGPYELGDLKSGKWRQVN